MKDKKNKFESNVENWKNEWGRGDREKEGQGQLGGLFGEMDRVGANLGIQKEKWGQMIRERTANKQWLEKGQQMGKYKITRM